MHLFRLFKFASMRTVWAAVLVGMTGGGASALIISLISRQLTGDALPTIPFALYFIGALITVISLNMIADWLLIRLAATTSYELGVHLARQILTTPFRRLEQTGSPRLFAVLTEDVSAISNALNSVPTLSISLAIVAGCLVYLAWLSPIALLTLAGLMIPAAAGYTFLHRRAKQMARLALRERNVAYKQYEMLTAGIKELQVNHRRQSAFMNSLLRPTLASFRGKLVKTRTLSALANSWSQAMYFIFILTLFLIAPTLQVDAAILTSYALIALYMRGSVNGILSSLPQWALAGVAINEIERLGFTFERKNGDPSLHSSTPLSTQPTTLDLRNVTHEYGGVSDEVGFTLGPVDLTLHSGQLVFLVGGNGSGKTTLVKLLVGLYTPESGTISLNGTPVAEANLEKYRQNFSVIFSDFYLFEQLLGIEDVNLDANALAYLMKLQLSHKVKVEDGKLSTIDLSQGQRQRLALLTAYMEDRPIYVFDEWAAGQDPHFKDIFYRELLPELRQRGKLVIVISHDDHYFDVADRIIKLDYGQIDSDVTVRTPVADYVPAF
ncbi:MAG: cyclic peptide export ABC transporter [Caldilineaceae bacterium]|nr:cyclic peptide export ABC transporter [Caldilineaceae bacterium]